MDVTLARSLHELGATEIVAKIAAGEITCEAVTRDCIERIAAREPVVKAWVNFNPELALAQAHALDREPRRGPLHGVPIGVKDVIDTFDMPTEMGSPIYRGYRPLADAACVALLRRAGVVILGKTATCELAGMAPAATTNPHNAAHTPGGSSSGSAAAVADFMVPAALGTQTGGSVLRPSSFCGVFGYKPTYNAFNKAGLKPAAESIDTIGWIGRSIEDIALLTAVLRMDEPQPLRTMSAAPRIGMCRTEIWDSAQPETKSAVENAATMLRKAGAVIRDVTLPEAFAGLHALARGTINHFERAACMAFEWDNHRAALSLQMRRYIESGLKTSRADYVAAWRRVEQCCALLPSVFEGLDVLLAPCVPGEAPKGLALTGDPSMQAMWTALHTPTMSVPTHRGPNNLPVGIQLIAQRYEDDRLFACARWIWDRIGAPEKVGVSRIRDCFQILVAIKHPMHEPGFTVRSLLLFAALAALASVAKADSVADFYKGRSISMIIGYSVGGGYDAYARLLARYIGRHIPGEPSIVPQQMTGAGSLRAANYIFSVAPKDGTVLGTFSRSMAIAPLLGQAEFDSRKFTWLGSMTDDDTTCVTWNSSPIKTWNDFLGKPSKLGGLGADADPDIWALLYKNVFGAKLQLVSGYPGTNDVVLAMERGEVDGLCGLSWSTIKTRHAEWLTSHSANIIVQAALKKEPEIATVPLVTDLVSNPEQLQIIRLLLISQAMARPFAAPPELPADCKSALIAAFDATMRDADFLAEAQKLNFETHPVSAATIDGLLAEVYATPKDVLARAAKAISSAGQ